MINHLIISAPFGNYIEFPHATSTLGTFTAKFRGGPIKRIWRVLSTVRYYPSLQAWKNKLGLPNPGVDWLIGKQYPNKIISVMGFNAQEWIHCIDVADRCKPLAIELNVSCPNCPGEDKTDYKRVFELIIKERFWNATTTELIVKLPPVGYRDIVKAAVDAGITSFHCCNTLPTPGGGLSGKPLKLLSLNCVEYVRELLVKRIIGGGGITHMKDTSEYLRAGCTNVSVGSVLFNPFAWRRIKSMSELILLP